jgi:flavorubredoxin
MAFLTFDIRICFDIRDSDFGFHISFPIARIVLLLQKRLEENEMPTALIVYATRSGQTKRIAHLVAEGMELLGVKTTVAQAIEITSEAQLDGYDCLVFGSPTYHGEMMHSIEALLALAGKAFLEGKVGGAFGAYGWSGEAPDQISEVMKTSFKMEMVEEPLKLKPALVGDSDERIRDFGRELAKKLAL